MALAAALLAGPPALAQDRESPPSNTVSGVTVTAPKVEREDPVICRKSNETGSRVRITKDCRKLSEWTAKAKARNIGVVEVKLGECSGSGSGPKGCEFYPRPNEPTR
ncbi:hypothetical protein [Phenylobacterium sp.]|uniref:hypothetical protein n=1 Tax=Phenylobacterium sp. TaxID=1871053 RepID=UPI0027351284|nr:hypothetical protein [Phenylobacterium sp.]MDP3855927.1 hypothetical protein [Phenylobacterium sp.]